MPIGKDAHYIKADLEPVSEGMTVDEDLIFLTPDAPVMDVYINNAEWSGRDRCPIEGGLLYSVPCPEDFVYGPDTWDGIMPNAGIASLLQDRRTIVQSQPFARCTAGQSGTSKYRYPDQDIYGQGIGGAHGGSGLSAIGGAIRSGELLPGAGPIKHALKINIYAAENIRYEEVNKGHRWPAPQADGYASWEYGTKRTKPFVDGVLMGALMALPSWMDLDNMGFETEPGRRVADAFQQYGAYIVDDTSWDTWALITSWEADGRVINEFYDAWGYTFETRYSDNGWARDIARIFENLHVVDNNSEESVGGGGEPLVPLAPEISPDQTVGYFFENTGSNRNSLKVYPNPVKSGSTSIYIESNLDKDGELIIYNLKGQVQVEKRQYQNRTPVSLNKLHPGTYIVNLRLKGNNLFEKLIVY